VPLTPEPAAPLYQTDISQMPLAEVLVKIHRYRAPGRVDCKHGEEVKRIYLDHGQIVFATTNQLAESLGDKLLREGRITRGQYDESVAHARESGKRHGTTLVEMKALSAEDLFTAVRGQIEEIIWPIFGWDSGTVSFTAGRDKRLEFIKVNIPVPMAILHGVRHVAEARTLVARLGTKTTLFGRSAGHTEGLVLDADEQNLLDAVDGRKVLYELVNTPPLTSSDNARILYAFFALGLIVPREPRQIKVQVKTDGGKYA
jgi:hypothetical protein